MIKIKFNDKEKFEKVEFSRTEHTVTLKGITEENTSGFCTYRLNGEQLGDFSDFKTIYNKGEDYVMYSYDGSVKLEPQPSPEPSTEPTWQETIEAQVLYTALMTDTILEEGE